MRKLILNLAALAIASAALAQTLKTKPASKADDDFFIVDPREAEYYRDNPKAAAEADADRKLIRDAEFKHGGVRWIPLKDAGLDVREMILKSDPDTRQDLREHGLQIDVAKLDFDHDGKTDLVFYDWSDGRADGYNYTVVFGKNSKPKRRFFGMIVKPYKDGILVDKAYYVL